MFGKTIFFIVVVAAVVSAEPCGYCGGYLPTGISGYGFSGTCRPRVLNVGCTIPVASATPACAPIATPSQIVESGIAAPVVASTAVTPVVSAGIVSPGLYRSGFYGGYGYGSTLAGYGTGILAAGC